MLFFSFYKKNLDCSNHLPFPLCWQFNSPFKSFGFSQVRSPHTYFNFCAEAWSLTIILLKLSETCHKTFFFFKHTHANGPHQIILLSRNKICQDDITLKNVRSMPMEPISTVFLQNNLHRFVRVNLLKSPMFVQAVRDFQLSPGWERSKRVSSAYRSRAVRTSPAFPSPLVQECKPSVGGWESQPWIFVDSLQIRGTVWLKSAFRAERIGFPAI